MTNPPSPPGPDPSPWARPGSSGGSGGSAGQPPAPSGSPTRRMPAGGQEEPTTRIPASPAHQAHNAQVPNKPKKTKSSTRIWRDPLALTLIAVTVVALTLAGLIVAELVGRRIADDKVAAATQCVVDDQVSVSFGISPPFLWQHITGNYTNISIETAGHQIKEAKEMKADLSISDVRLHSEGNSSGTIGELDATLTWPSEGIKETIQTMVPLLGNLVSDVTTNASNGTVELKGAFGLAGVTVKPLVVNGALSLQVESLTGLGSMTLPRETIQPTLDSFAKQLTKKYPLGLHADSVQVIDTGVVAHFSTRNAPIPSHTDDPCFAHL